MSKLVGALNHIWVYLVLACVVPALFSAVVSVGFNDFVTRIFARVVGRVVPRHKRRIDGVWFSVFWFHGSKENTIVQVQNLIRLRTLGARFVGETIAAQVSCGLIEISEAWAPTLPSILTTSDTSASSGGISPRSESACSLFAREPVATPRSSQIVSSARRSKTANAFGAMRLTRDAST